MKVYLDGFRYVKGEGKVVAKATVEMAVDEFRDIMDAGEIGIHYAGEQVLAHIAVLTAAAKQVNGDGLLARIRQAVSEIIDGIRGSSGYDGY